MNCSTPDFPVLHYLPEFPHIHVHWVSDTNQPTIASSVTHRIFLNIIVRSVLSKEKKRQLNRFSISCALEKASRSGLSLETQGSCCYSPWGQEDCSLHPHTLGAEILGARWQIPPRLSPVEQWGGNKVCLSFAEARGLTREQFWPLETPGDVWETDICAYHPGGQGCGSTSYSAQADPNLRMILPWILGPRLRSPALQHRVDPW